jgi:hypothetical protein
MKQIGLPPRTPAAWDVPATTVADEFAALKTAALTAGLAAETRHLLDPYDEAFAALACAHPDTCSTPDTYPGWTPGGTR